MNGTLAQLISLATYGNQFLKGDDIAADFYPSNSAFLYCNSVKFAALKKAFLSSKLKEGIIAENPVAWFAFLKLGGCRRLSLYYQESKDQTFAKDFKLAGFVGGGGTWLIEAVYQNHSDYWANRWEVTDEKNPNRNIWSVTYCCVAPQKPTGNIQVDLLAAKQTQHRVLAELIDFSAKLNLKPWSGFFQKAFAALSDKAPVPEYYKDFIEGGEYSLDARQLLTSASISFVFGGMGSWNDIGFEVQGEEDTYEELSGRLYSSINSAIIAVVNA